MNKTGKLNCECIKEMDAALELHNARIETGMMFSMETSEEWEVMLLPLEKLDPKQRGRLPKISMKYCPMCGKLTGSTAAKGAAK